MNQSDGPKILGHLENEIKNIHQQIKTIRFTDWQDLNHTHEISKIIRETAQSIFEYMERQCEVYEDQSDPSYFDPSENQ